MIVKATGKGKSFKGAGLYYLHDKGALTKARVAFTHTENLATDNPNVAIAMMIRTATSQNEIKRRAGGSARGRKLATPVYTYCLSWAYDEKPTRDQMIAAARETLVALGLEGHEALFITHTDEPQPHIHIIANRVNPDTGIAAPLSKDQNKFSEWAQGYEQRQGKIRVPRRVANNERRRKGEYVKDARNDNSAAFHDWRRKRVDEDFARRRETEQELTAAHRAQRQALFADKEAQIRATKAKIREEHKPMWRMLYLHEKQARNKLEIERDLSAKLLKNFLKNSAKGHFHAERQEKSGRLSTTFANAVDAGRKRQQLHADQLKGRAAFAARIAEKQRVALKQINDQYKRDLEDLKSRQQRQLQELAARQSAESQETARRITRGEDRADYLKEQFPKYFGDAAKDRPRAAGVFNGAAPDRPRPSRDFKKAADNAVTDQRPAGRASSGGSGKSPEAFRENVGDMTVPAKQKTARRPLSAREQRAIERQRQIREEAQDITAQKDSANEKNNDRGRERTLSRRDKPPTND